MVKCMLSIYDGLYVLYVWNVLNTQCIIYCKTVFLLIKEKSNIITFFLFIVVAAAAVVVVVVVVVVEHALKYKHYI